MNHLNILFVFLTLNWAPRRGVKKIKILYEIVAISAVCTGMIVKLVIKLKKASVHVFEARAAKTQFR